MEWVRGIPYLQKLLNIDDRKRKLELDDLNNQLNHAKKKKVLLKNFKMQVNYVFC